MAPVSDDSAIGAIAPVGSIRSIDYARIRRIAHQLFGLDLKDGKEALVAARFASRIRAAGLRNVKEFLDRVETDRAGEAAREFIDALTTNFTSFLRETDHFDCLRQRVLSEWPAPQAIRIWSAGCSTGEEPYTILFTVLDAEPQTQRLELYATDLSRPVLQTAQSGVYDEKRLADLPPAWLPRFFQRGQGRWEGQYRVKAELRQRIRFERRNLIEPMDSLPKFHVIFCRNVMIYFDRVTQQQLVQQFAAHLEPGGFLFIGHSEGLMAIQHSLDFLKAATYRKPGKR